MNPSLEQVVTIIAGTLLTFGGWSLYRFGIRLAGFLIGFAIGGGISYSVLRILALQHPSIEIYQLWIILGVGVLLGLLNARIMLKAYYLIVFILGAVYGAALKATWLDQWPAAAPWLDQMGVLGQSPWGELIVGLLLGLLCVLLHRYMVILLTSLVGSGLISQSTQLYWLFPFLVFLGIVSQLGFLRLFRMRPREWRKAP